MTPRRIKTILASALIAIAGFALLQNLHGGEKKIDHRIERLYDLRDPQFQRSMGSLLGAPILTGNAVVDLQNGDAIFPAMLQSIRQAQRSIAFETYIYWSGEIGEAFAAALSERARAGVKVHVLLDWMGSVKMEDRFLERMRVAGVEVERYHKPHWYNLSRMNNRTHRKLLVVDGRVAYTGGVGIADQWEGHAQDPDHWRDTHFRVEGPVVAQFQSVFMDNWIKATGRVLHGEAYFPPLPEAGQTAAQMVSSSPTGGSESVHLMYLMAIEAAHDSIDLASAYFVPDEMAVNALVAAARRGVKLRIITPGGHIDTETVRAASRARWGRLLEAGVEISEYEPTMYHLKMMIVDGHFVSVGSTNFDNRSFRLNDEANLNVYDDAFARRCEEVFRHDLARARRIGLEEWRHRPWSERLWERATSALGAQL